MNPNPNFFALLIGIDKYDPRSRVPHLRGCVTDATAMEHLLQERFGVPTDHILCLSNEEATHAQIKEAFRTHLIGNAKRLAATGATQKGVAPAFLFQYSGHGSQAIDETGQEPDGLDETLVPYDSRTPGIFDIKDWEIGALIEELNQYSDNVTIILDCCHSGSGTRDAELTLTRRCAPDLRPQPPTSQRPQTSTAKSRAVTAGDWELSGQHVLLAGCRDKEESHEYAAMAGGRRHWQGAMSYFLQQELRQLSSTHETTYRELFERVRHAVNKTYPNQMPQMEGDIDRALFAGLRPERDPFYTVIDRHNGLFWIDGGVAHGLLVGSELRVYPPETRTLADAGSPLGTLRIVEEGAVRSGCEVEEDGVAIPLHARCAVHRLRAPTMQRNVQVLIDDPELQAAVTKRLQASPKEGQLDVSPWLRLVAPNEVADFRIVAVDHTLEVQDSAGNLLVAAFDHNDLDGLADDLAHLVRYYNALDLRNHAPSELTGAIDLSLKKLDFDLKTQEPIGVALPHTVGGDPIVEVGERVVFEVTNRSEEPLYFALFDFSCDWSVTQIYPTVKGAHEALKPGGTFSFGLTKRRRSQNSAQLPDGFIEATERFKVIATKHETNFELIEQGRLKTPFTTRAVGGATDADGATKAPTALDLLLGRAINGNQRAFGPPPATVADEWTTAELSVLVTTPAAQMAQTLRPNSRVALPAFDLAIETPAAFTGTIRVLTDQQSRAAVALGQTSATDAIVTPPGLAAFQDRFEPMQLGNRRSAMPLGTLIELEADNSARKAVSPGSPMTINFEWPIDENERIFAVAQEEGMFFPVGHSTATPQRVAISWLPPTYGSQTTEALSTTEEDADEAEQAETRTLGRTLKLYFYKLVGLEEESLGLHRVQYIEPDEVEWIDLEPGEFLREFEGGALLYSPIDETAILPRQRVAVAVHGFSADSKTIGRWLTTVFPKAYPAYDHVLAFDYESLSTGVDENGRKLADALRALEVDVRPRVRVDMFAHSMGSLITRCMVEKWGGANFVNRCFFAGPPNQGTRLADAKIFVPWITSLALNSVGGWPPAIIAEWVLGKLEQDAIGIDDLRPSSTILTDLNHSTKAILVKYYILAGNNPLLPVVDEAILQRLMRKIAQGLDIALDAIFDDQNDLVINVGSMLGLRNGHHPSHLLQTREVPCNHFSYFDNDTAQETLLAWLQ